MSKLSEIMEFNPTRTLRKWEIAPFIEMASLPTNAKFVEKVEQKEFNGGGAKFKNGDVLFARITPCLENGKTAQVTELKDDEIGFGSTEFIVMSAKEPEFDKDYIYYFSRLPEFRQYAQSRMEGTSGRQRVSWQSLSEFEFDFPDKEIRKSAGDFLKVFDQKIQLNTQINQTLEQIAQTIFKSWFIDFDPVHAKANALANGATTEQATLAAMQILSGKTEPQLTAYQTQHPESHAQLYKLAQSFPSEFEEIDGVEVPKGWEVMKFKTFVTESKERVGVLENVDEYSVGNTGIYPRNEKYKKTLSKTPEKNKVVRAGDLVFGMGSKELNWGIMINEIGSVSPAYFVYRIKQNIVNYIYLKNYIKNRESEFQDLIKPTSRQGQSVDKDLFLDKSIYTPNKDLISEFFNYYNLLSEEISLIQKNTNYLEETRDLLLPKLLSGEVEL